MLLGGLDAPRLPVFSFLVKHESSGTLVHHNLVSALLHDLFGIQARGGCACAGPYAMVSRLCVSAVVVVLWLAAMEDRVGWRMQAMGVD